MQCVARGMHILVDLHERRMCIATLSVCSAGSAWESRSTTCPALTINPADYYHCTDNTFAPARAAVFLVYFRSPHGMSAVGLAIWRTQITHCCLCAQNEMCYKSSIVKSRVLKVIIS